MVSSLYLPHTPLDRSACELLNLQNMMISYDCDWNYIDVSDDGDTDDI